MRIFQWFMFLLSAGLIHAKCPSNCSCYLDIRGRNAIECKKGGMSGPLSLNEMEPSVQVLKISAPEDNLNSLTMSPDIRSFTNLEEVHITKSNVPILGQHFFYGLERLLILDLSQNNITQPLDHNFRGLDRLQELYLDDNRIHSLPSGTFRYLGELRILSIQRNKMQEMPPAIFQQLDKLQELKLSGNLFGALNPEVFKDIQNLRKLECRSCGLSSVGADIYNLIPHLIHLDLGDNHLEQLVPNEFDNLTKLKSLKLDGNQIKYLPEESFSKLYELRKLTLARNKLAVISKGAFENLTKLNELDLGYNNLNVVDTDILRPAETSLEKLILSGNNLKPYNIKYLVKNLKGLKNLQVADAHLTDFEEIFVPDTLTHLNLAGNYLSLIPADAIPYSLIELDLSKNRFRGFHEDVMQRIENTPKIKLDSNPWSCDLCYIFPLLSRANKSDVVRNLRCATPYHFENKMLGSLHKEELNWCSTPTYQPTDTNLLLILGDENKVGIIAAGASIVLLVLTILSILGALIYSRRHAAKYYTHEEKRSPERESIFENQTPLFEDKELSFKFPLDPPVKKISIATIDELKKEQDLLSNGT